MQVIATTDRAAVGHLIADEEHVDVIVPRGGKGLIERIAREAKVPVIKHLDGVCHVFIDASADLDMAVRIADNAKTQRYSPCNAMETLLVHADIAARVLPPLCDVYADKGVELRGCERSRAIVPAMTVATEDDWYAEYLAPILAVRVVDTLDDAIAHIAKYGSQHTDAIVTQDHAQRDALPARGRFELGARQRVDAVRRRLRIRARRRDRHLHQQAARARARRARGPHEPQVDRAGLGADPHLIDVPRAQAPRTKPGRRSRV